MKIKLLILISLLAILIVMAGCATQDLAGEAGKAVGKDKEPYKMPAEFESERYTNSMDISNYAINQPELTVDEINNLIEEEGASWIPKENKFTRKSEEELKILLGLKPNWEEIEGKRVEAENYKGQRNGLPDYFDWGNQHDQDYVTPIRDQESCGSCWAFATLAAVEGNANAYFNNPDLDPDLSEQDLVSCFHGQGCGGLSTDEFPTLLNYLVAPKVCSEECFPYTATNNDCANKCSNWQDDSWGINAWQEVLFVRDEIKTALIMKGPLITGMEVYSDFFDYDGGIYHHVTGSLLGYHAVTIVGYNNYDGLEYWIVKNSWGEDWGEDGYFRILMGNSGIDSLLMYAIDSPNPTIPEQVICNDGDLDGYCNWGLGNKPTNCPVCDDLIEDCDDSDINIFEDCGILDLPLGTLEITSVPDDAEVYVKDIASGNYFYRGKTPLSIDLTSGEREVKLEKIFYLDYETTIIIVEDDVVELNVNLEHDPLFQEGWPILINIDSTTFNSRMHDSIVADLENDGESDVLVTYSLDIDESYIDAYTFGGIQKNNFPIFVPGGIKSHASLADFDEDGDMEIVITYEISNLNHTVAIYNHDGTVFGGWPIQLSSVTGFLDPPSVGDIDGDGDLEIVIGTHRKVGSVWQGEMYAWHHDGTPVDGWPVNNGHWGPFYATPALGDIDGDGDLEIIAGCWDKNLYAWHHDGTLVNGWPVLLDPTDLITYQAPQIADLDNDGDMEVIQITNNDGVIYVVDKDANIIRVMTPPEEGIPSSPAIGDIDHDNDLEIFVNIGYSIYAWHHDGTLVAGWPVDVSGSTGQFPVSPTLGDIDGDSNTDVVFMSAYDGVSVFNSQGELINNWEHALQANNIRSSPSIVDLDEDRKVELVFTYYYLLFPPNPSYFVISVLNPGSPYDASTIEWPMFQHDERHTGNYHSQCSDNTFIGECSLPKPKYCDTGELVDNCQKCGCPPNTQCQTSGICRAVKPRKATAIERPQ